jgi:hypothetical protein
MSAQIRPNRMEVSDRFPMLGFAVRADQPNVDAEVVLATDINLFHPERRANRTAANFYSSREHGLLHVPRGESVFVVPPEVLARFIGHERLYFGLATGRRENGGLHVEALPREGSPYVALRGFTGRTLRRSFGGASASRAPVLEWTGDAARPGSEPSPGANGHGGNGNGASALHGRNNSMGGNGSTNGGGYPATGFSTAYDDGFGEMPVLPGDPRARARRIGGAFADRIGEALDLGVSPQTVDPILQALEAQPVATPMNWARGQSTDDTTLEPVPPPAPRARAMNAGIAAAQFVVETIRDRRGGISWDLDQFRGIKHPNDTAPANAGAFKDGATINLNDWPIARGLVDDMSAWFKIDWQYNGRSLGNVRIQNTGTNDRVLYTLHVTAKIMDDNRVHPPNNCAALRINFHYRFSRRLGSEAIAVREITIYGDGTYETSGRWLQASAFELSQAQEAAPSEDETLEPVPAPAPRARAMDGGAAAAIAIGGFVVETIRDSRGGISWDLDQFRGIKHPNDTAPSNAGPFHDGATINLNDWPVARGLADDMSAWFKIDWQYNGKSLGNVRIQNTGTNDRVLYTLHVTAKIMDDNRVHPPHNCAALRLNFHYRFARRIGSEAIAVRDVTLYGDGTYEVDGRWLQASAFAVEPQHQQATGNGGYAHA